MARTWNAVLARQGVRTGDGRILAEGGITSRTLPLPLLWQRQTEAGHGGAIVVGRIETLDFANGMITATGSFLDVRGAAEAAALTDAGVTGPSVDLFDDVDVQEAITLIEAGVLGPDVMDGMDDIEYVVDGQGSVVIVSGRIAAATLVPIPAFTDVFIELDAEAVKAMPAEGPVFALTASVRSDGWSALPIADEGRPWDGAAAADRVLAWATTDGETDWSRYARAFLRRDDDADPDTKGAYGFGIADVIDGELTIVPRGVFAAAAATEGARGGGTPEDAEAMQRVLRGIYERMDRPAPFSLTASLAAFAVATRERLAPPVLPPAEWFGQPDVDRLTPLTVSDTGRVFGHIAPWDQCHVGMPGCVTAPSSATGYAHFHTSSQPVQGGAEIPVGVLVTGPRHADPQAAFRAAQQHYDDLDAAMAKVVAGEDEFGIWVAGWALPGADPLRMEQFMSSPVSGDWRRVGGSLEMIAVCSVNAPGFPVARARVAFANGHQTSLIGSFGITAQRGAYEDRPAAPDYTSVQVAHAKWAAAKWKRVNT